MSCSFIRSGIEDPRRFLLIRVVNRTRMHSQVQFFQALSDFGPPGFTGIAIFTVWAVHSQEGLKVASQLHARPRSGIQIIRPSGDPSGANSSCERPTALCHMTGCASIVPNRGLLNRANRLKAIDEAGISPAASFRDEGSGTSVPYYVHYCAIHESINHHIKFAQ